MIGKWKGSYKFDSKTAREKLGVEKTYFTISIDTVENNNFKGTVEDDLETKGTPGTGEINGTISGQKLFFTKQMPIKTVIALNNDMRTYGIYTYPEKKHRPIYYEGTLSSDKISIVGTWKMQIGFSIFGYYVVLLRQTGTWEMHQIG
jgi:hypothetical protein